MIIKITLIPHKGISWPNVKILLNNNTLLDQIVTPNNNKFFIFEKEITSLNDTNNLIIEHYNKKNEDTIVDNNKDIIRDKAIELITISFDNIDIPKVVLYDNKFYPDWPINIIKEHKGNPPKFITNNLYFGFNGKYIINFSKNYKAWYFEQLVKKERMSNEANQELMTLPSGEVIETFEFAGKTLKANETGNLTIDELYALIKE